MKRYLFTVFVLLYISAVFAVPASAHPGRTDANGGHRNHSTGGYHYHHGYSAHDHYDIDGNGEIDCPVNFVNREKQGSNESDNGVQNADGSYAELRKKYLQEPTIITDQVIHESNIEETKNDSLSDRYGWLLPAFIYLGIPAILLIVPFFSSAFDKLHTIKSNKIILKKIGGSNIKLPSNIVLLQNGTSSLGKPTPFAPYGEFTVYVSSNGRTFHKNPRCIKSGKPMHIYEIPVFLAPCRRCAKTVKYPVIVPSWYEEIKKKQIRE